MLQQLCHFHPVQILNRYLTRHPKTDTGKALRQLALSLKHSIKSSFQAAFDVWYGQHKAFPNEKTGKSSYTHRRLRSAYFSLKRNLPYLFVFEDYTDSDICNTTNPLDGRFADLKQKLGCHQDMSSGAKIKFIKIIYRTNKAYSAFFVPYANIKKRFGKMEDSKKMISKIS